MEENEKEENASDNEIHKEAIARLKSCIEDEANSRELMKDDLRFATLDQWDAQIRADRENDPNGPRPCLTIDKINQYITQVTNDIRQNKPSIKMRPVDDMADVETARIMQDYARHIQDRSNASVAYETASDWAVKCGLGYFRVVTDYVSPDSFDQEILIKRIPNMFSVYLGPHTQPDGSDAEYGFILEEMALETFKREYPNATVSNEDFSGEKPVWKTEETITVAEYFHTVYEKKTLLFLADGTTVFADKYDGQAENIVDERTSFEKKIKWCKLSGAEILEKRDWAGSYIPIIEVIGKESFVDGKRVTWGLVRPAKDNLRMYNYWASAVTEKIGLSPKTPFIGAVGQFESFSEKWAQANRTNYAYLEYDAVDVNGNAIPAPRRVEPAPMEVAMVNMMATIERDVQTSLGMFKAAVGESESQQSGKAILALQRESDTGTLHFADNLARSIRYCGLIILDLIPKIIDTRRILRVIGEDGETQNAMVDPKQPMAKRQIRDAAGKIHKIYNPGVGKYDVTVTVGPSYNTKRMEAADAMLKLTQANPALGQIMGDLMFKSFDWPMADKISERLQKMLPPQIQDQPEGQPQIPPQVMQQMAQAQQQMQALQQQMQELAQENQQLKSGVQTSMAKLSADKETKMAELSVDAQVEAEKLRILEEKTNKEIELKRAIAEADYEIEQRKLDQQLQAKQNEANTNMDAVMQNNVLPQLMEQLNGAFYQIGELMQQQLKLQQQTLETLQKPRNVSIGGVKKDADGRIVSATVNTTIQ